MTLAIALPARSEAAEKGVVPDLTWGISAAGQDRTAAAVKDVGAGWVRLSMSWSDAEPRRGVYSASWFARYDRAVELSRAKGARVVFMAYQSPSWASGSSDRDTKPRDPADFAAFMSYVARRYAGRVAAWEIWNEENTSRFWSTGPSPAEYTQLLQAAYPAVKGSDPAASVLVGGLSANDYEYLQGMYDAGARAYFDGANVHPYTGANDPATCWNQAGTTRKAKDAFCGYEEVYATMSANGDAGKALWMTEMGYSTTSGQYGMGEDKQAEYLVKAYRRLERHPYVKAMFWYQLRNNSLGGDDSGSWEGNLGLLRADYSNKPAYDALKGYTPGAGDTPAARPADAAPQVRLTSLSDGASFAKRLPLRASASDDRGIAKVEFRVDGRTVGSDNSAPYAMTWSASKMTAYGRHTVTAVAYDTAGKTASTSVRVVRGTTTLSVSAGATVSSAGAGSRRRVVARGTVGGARSGRVRILLRRYDKRLGRWVKSRGASASVDRKGRYRATVSVSAGSWEAQATYIGQLRMGSAVVPFKVR